MLRDLIKHDWCCNISFSAVRITSMFFSLLIIAPNVGGLWNLSMPNLKSSYLVDNLGCSVNCATFLDETRYIFGFVQFPPSNRLDQSTLASASLTNHKDNISSLYLLQNGLSTFDALRNKVNIKWPWMIWAFLASLSPTSPVLLSEDELWS